MSPTGSASSMWRSAQTSTVQSSRSATRLDFRDFWTRWLTPDSAPMSSRRSPGKTGAVCSRRGGVDSAEKYAAPERRVSFEQDIRPLFRPQDVEEMSWAFDLSSY